MDFSTSQGNGTSAVMHMNNKDNISSGAQMSTEPAHFDIYHDQHQKFTGGLHLFLKTLNYVLAPFGLRRIITGPNTHRNKNPLTMDQFP